MGNWSTNFGQTQQHINWLCSALKLNLKKRLTQHDGFLGQDVLLPTGADSSNPAERHCQVEEIDEETRSSCWSVITRCPPPARWCCFIWSHFYFQVGFQLKKKNRGSRDGKSVGHIPLALFFIFIYSVSRRIIKRRERAWCFDAWRAMSPHRFLNTTYLAPKQYNRK